MNSIKHWQINIFYIMTAMFWAAVYTYQPIMSPYLQSIGLEYTMIGIISGSYGFTQMVLRIPIGILSDRFGKRKVFVIGGLFLSAFSSLFLFIADNPYAILLGRSLAGAAASSWVVFTVLFSGYFDKSKAASRISFLSISNNTGQVIAMLLGGIAAGYLGYKSTFALGAAIGCIGLALGFFIKENVPVRKAPLKIFDLISVSKNRNLITMSLLAVLSQTILFGTSFTFTPVIAADLGASGNTLGYLSMIGSIPRILSSVLCGVLLARGGNTKRLLCLSYVMLALGSAVTPFCPDIFSLIIASIVTGFGSGISMTILLSLCIRDIEDTRVSAAMGFFQAIYGLGMFLGPVVTGFFTDGFGMTWGFMFSAFIAVIGIFGSLKTN